MDLPNKNIRLKILEIIYKAGEGHIPSAFSIVEILSVLYGKFLKFKSKDPDWPGRDYFILSKGHGCTALYVFLEKYGFISQNDLNTKSKFGGILGGHPDSVKVPGVEASTGSLGHGVVTAMGIALGLKIRKQKNRVVALIGDGESNEGTVWEMALVAANLKLGNLAVIVDKNGSTDQILPMPNLPEKWQSFGWEVYEVDGHNEKEIWKILKKFRFSFDSKPKVIIARTLKGRGVSFMEGHGVWHSRVPISEEYAKACRELI